ncbi:polyamine aminopropyltransferase [Marivirga lumbricoides]
MNFKIKILSFSVFVAGLCSIIYELLISATASYFLGDGVRQFSILIGIYLFSMGIGAYCSKFFKQMPLAFFISIEFLIGLIGGMSVPLLYFMFIYVSPMVLQIICLAIMFVIGLLTGMEVPLLTFINTDDDYKDNLSNVLSLDYLGGLIATLIFPFILLPFVGLFYSSLLFGIINICLGLWLNLVLIRKRNKTFYFGLMSLIVLLSFVASTGYLLKIWDEKIYKSPVVTNIQTPHQKIVITKRQEDIRLFLNRALQFSSLDEYRYHELLVHVPLSIHSNPKNILILGGGENLASREVLKHSTVNYIDVVDIDEEIFHLAQNDETLLKINQGAANNSKVNLIVDDAFSYLHNNLKLYDVIISDLPDPSNDGLARLYSKQFFMLIKKSLSKNGLFVTQSGEIYYSNNTFSCIKNTVDQVFNHVEVYQTHIPSFGNWGFTIASGEEIDVRNHKELPDQLKFLTDTVFHNSFIFPKDIALQETKINTIDNPVILSYFLDEWEKWRVDLGMN